MANDREGLDPLVEREGNRSGHHEERDDQARERVLENPPATSRSCLAELVMAVLAEASLCFTGFPASNVLARATHDIVRARMTYPEVVNPIRHAISRIHPLFRCGHCPDHSLECAALPIGRARPV